MGLQLRKLFFLGLLGVVAAGCGTTAPAMPNPVTEPMIDQPGRYIVRYRDAVIDGYLVDHEPPYGLKTRLSENGIAHSTSAKRWLPSIRTRSS